MTCKFHPSRKATDQFIHSPSNLSIMLGADTRRIEPICRECADYINKNGVAPE